MKIKLALIGKDISHSQSQSKYESLLKQKIDYTLLDCFHEEQIPLLPELRDRFDGVSITSPYKKYFLGKVQITDPKIKSINTLVFTEKNVLGFNTDYLAATDILAEYKNLKNINNLIILGDGAMSEVIELICQKLELKCQILSRRNKKINELKSYIPDISSRTLVVNTCARSFMFRPDEANCYYWDLNYGLNILYENYQDGLPLLELQAKYALKLWNL